MGSQKLVLARLGEHNLDDNVDDGASPKDFAIVNITTHKDYNQRSNNFDNDIAILTLNETVEFSEAIAPICLPSFDVAQTQDVSLNKFVASQPFVAGWGTTEYRGPASDQLLEIQLEVQENSKCGQAFQELPGVNISSTKICAYDKFGLKDSCQGDSGGPLMWPFGSAWFQIGIVSFGYRCAQPGFPGVYTRLTEYTQWIQDQIQQLNWIII